VCFLKLWTGQRFLTYQQSKIFILSKQEQYSTLAKYIDPENIPEQYGGKLKYKFGDLPNIDPALHNVIKWTAPHKLNGMDTIPAGPIRWVITPTGDRVAIAVGSENGKRRDIQVAISKHPQQSTSTASGATQHAPTDASLYRTTSGEHTHPPSPPPGQEAKAPPADSN
jgi:hypothetical protein